jgi:hypothetical protein
MLVDTTRKAKWFWGQPVKSSWAGIYRLNDTTTLKPKIELKETTNLGFSWVQVINKNVRVNFSHDLDVTQSLGLTKSSSSPYNFGLQFNFTL